MKESTLEIAFAFEFEYFNLASVFKATCVKKGHGGVGGASEAIPTSSKPMGNLYES